MSRRSDEQLVALICAELDRLCAMPDARLQSRLDNARQQALQHGSLSSGAEEQAWAVAARTALDQEGELPPEVASRLDAIRSAALSRLASAPTPASTDSGRITASSRHWQAWLSAVRQRWQFPAGMVATGIVLVTAISLLEPLPSTDILSTEQELALLASAEDIELYENLDFYLWLADRGFVTQ